MGVDRKTLVILIAVLAGAALLRYAYVELTTIGDGAYATSPDGKYYAEAWSYHGKKYFGGSHSWGELEIKAVNGPVVWSSRIDGPGGNWSIRDSGAVVTWAEDSSSVTFSAPNADEAQAGIEVTVRIVNGVFVVE